jgi:hypothetical protein
MPFAPRIHPSQVDERADDLLVAFWILEQHPAMLGEGCLRLGLLSP